jgi:1,4-alpha-glucan branching enzyme
LPEEAKARVAAAAAAAAAPKPSAPAAVRRVEFIMDSPFAQQVHLAGDFNGWEMSTLPLRKDADGLWRTTIELKAGSYQYKFLVDGQWVNDPNCPRTAANQFGSLNNVIEVA